MIGKDINNTKVELMDEVKNLCSQIQKVQTFSGLISLQSRVSEINEKLIVLKYLDQKSILSDSVNVSFGKSNVEVANEVKNEVNISGVVKYPAIALNLNDRIAFQNQLFNKDKNLLEKAIKKLNKTSSFSEAKEILYNYSIEFNWESKEDFAHRIETLVEKRFN